MLSIFLGASMALPFLAVRAQATPPIPTQVVFSQVQTSTLTVDWQGTTGTTIQFLLEVSSSAFVTPLSSTTVLLSSTFTALDVNTLYFAVVQASDTVDGSTSAFTTSISTYTLANPPLTLFNDGHFRDGSRFILGWEWKSIRHHFSIERSTDGVIFGSIGTVTSTTYQDFTVFGGTLSYRVQALNGDNIATVYTNVVTVPISTALISLKNSRRILGSRPNRQRVIPGHLPLARGHRAYRWQPVA